MNLNYDVLDDTEKMIYALRSLYSEYGYERYRMRKFEEYDLYGKNKDFLISDSVITFTDTNGKLMALKPDVTLSIIKNNKDPERGIHKLCYNESVYRVSKGTNTFREIMQTGLECFGEIDDICIGEVLLLAAKSLNLASDRFMLEITNLNILSMFLDMISDRWEIRSQVLKCVSEKNVHGITGVCLAHDIDEGRSVPLKRLLGLYGNPEDVLPKLRGLCEEMARENCFDQQVLNNLGSEITGLERALQVFQTTRLRDSIQIDFSLTGDMKYYNGIIFKGFLDGIPEGVLSGGQYDHLMKKMGRKSSAIGFAVYLDLLDRLNLK